MGLLQDSSSYWSLCPICPHQALPSSCLLSVHHHRSIPSLMICMVMGFLKEKRGLTLPYVTSVLTLVSHYQGPGLPCHPASFWPSFECCSLPSPIFPFCVPNSPLNSLCNLPALQFSDHTTVYHSLLIYSSPCSDQMHCAIRIFSFQIIIILISFPLYFTFWGKPQTLDKCCYISSSCLHLGELNIAGENHMVNASLYLNHLKSQFGT